MNRQHGSSAAIAAALFSAALSAAWAETITVPGPSGPGPANAFAEAVDLNLSSHSHGTWTSATDTDLWEMTIVSPGASSMSVEASDITLPEGATLNIGGEAFTAAISSSIRSWPSAGDELAITMTVPAGMRHAASVAIHTVYAGYPDEPQPVDAAPEIQTIPKAAGDQINYACIAEQTSEHANLSRATVVLVGGGRQCTGSFLNHDAAESEAWVITASHCADDAERGQTPENMGDRVAVRHNIITPCGSPLGSAFSGSAPSIQGPPHRLRRQKS